MALDTLRAAVWTPSDVPLDRAGRRLPGWRDCPVCVELHYRRRNRWFRAGMAADRSSVVCAADHIPADYRIDTLDTYTESAICSVTKLILLRIYGILL